MASIKIIVRIQKTLHKKKQILNKVLLYAYNNGTMYPALCNGFVGTRDSGTITIDAWGAGGSCARMLLWSYRNAAAFGRKKTSVSRNRVCGSS